MSILNLRSEDPTPEIVESDALDETPPGLDAIRAWLRKPHPWFRGVWLWIRWILRGLRDTFRLLATNAPRAAEKVRVVARKGAPVVRAAARLGQGVQRVGVRVSAAAGAFRDPEGKNLGTERQVRRAGDTTQKYGERIAAGSEVAGAVLSVLGSVAGVFTPKPPISIDPRGELEGPSEEAQEAPEPDSRFLPRRPDKHPSAPTDGRTERIPNPPQPGADPDSTGEVKETPAELPHESRTATSPQSPHESPAPGEATRTPPELPQQTPAPGHAEVTPPDVPREPPAPAEAREDAARSSTAEAPDSDPQAPPQAPGRPERQPPPASPSAPPEDRFEGVPKEFLPQVKSLRERTPANQLHPLILSLCLAREWTTAKQLARWFSMHRPGLVQRHLGPLVDAGFLILRFPDKVRSRNQAYRTNPDKWPPRR